MSTTVRRHKLALGMWEMLAVAVLEHQAAHQGRKPKRIEMHPENWQQLCLDPRILQQSPLGERIFMGVPILVSPKVDQLRMLTSDNELVHV